MGIFTESLDGHSIAATYYYPDRVKALIGDYDDDLESHKEASRKFKHLVDSGNPEAISIRQDSKVPSFKLAYGGYPDVDKGGVITKQLFDAYHNELYPGITDFRENYVLPTAIATGQSHLGLGFCLQTDDPDRDIRTLNNANSQFWSILTGLAINKLHQLIDEAGYQNDILVTSTIYDSIYFEVREDPVIIKWLNDRIVTIMEQDFIEGQVVHNSANLELGNDWAKLIELPHEATLYHITSVLETLHEYRNQP